MKRWLAILTAIGAAWALLFGRRRVDHSAVQTANEAADKAQAEAVNAKADLAKEKINNEAQAELDSLNDMSDSELLDSVNAEYQQRTGRPDVEDPDAG